MALYKTYTRVFHACHERSEITVRLGFQRGIMTLAEETDLQIISGDHGYSLFDDFRSRFPRNFHNVGVSEANAVSVAAGMSKAGLRTLVYGLASFIPGRVYEFMKIQVALEGLPVIFAGDGAGVVYSHLGHSHQSLEDLALATSLPNFDVFSPSSDGECETILTALADSAGPTYLRLGKSDGTYSGNLPSGNWINLIARGDSSAVAVVTHGSMTSVVKDLMDSGAVQKLDLWSLPLIKGRDFDQQVSRLSRYEKLLVIEEHFPVGGLATQLSQSPNLAQVALLSLGASTQFHSHTGSYKWTLDAIGMSQENISRFVSSSI